MITSPFTIILTDIEQARLTKLTCSARAEHRLVLRARIVLAAAQQTSNAAIAAETGLHVDTVRKWRRRFCQHRIGGLTDRRRSGRPVSFTAVQVAEVKQLACTLPAETGVALSRWSSAELAGETMRRGVVTSISASTIRRWLTRDAIKPWQHRSWIFPRDPDFAAKAARVLDLYARSWNGEPLGDNDYVISADEKSQLQALRRRCSFQPGQDAVVDRIQDPPRRRGRGHRPEQARLVPQHRKVGDRLSAVGQQHRQIGEHPTRSMRRTPLPTSARRLVEHLR
jgi:transposase